MAHVIKKGSIKVPTQPKDYDLQATGLVFKSYDNQIALEFNVEQQNGTPADLLGANLRLLMFIYDEVDGMITKEPIPFITKNLITESFLNGQVVYILPEAMKAYNGMVEAYVYIEYPDGSTSDNLGFTFRMKRSAIDGLAQDKADYFIADFQQLLDGVKQEATDAVNAALTNVDSTIEKANQQINEFVEGATQAIDQTVDEVTEQLQATQTKIDTVSQNVTSAQNNLKAVEDKMNQTNQQIGDLGKLKKMYSNSIDFGNYDYSGNPNLMSKLKSSDFNVGYHGSLTSDNEKLHFTSDGTGSIIMFTRINTPQLTSGKTYTLSAKVRFDEGTTGAIDKLRLVYRTSPGEKILLEANSTNITTDDVGKEITIKGTANVNYQITNLDRFYMSISFVDRDKINGGFKLYDIKIEEGSTATPYQPNLLDAPYYLSKVALGENLIKPESQQPVTNSNYLINTYNIKPMVKGKKYTITLEGTKPATQVFRPFFTRATGDAWEVGDLQPVEGLTNVWSKTFTAADDSHPTTPQVQIYQVPSTSVGQCTIKWLKLEEGNTRTPNISEYKYRGTGMRDSNNPKDYVWDLAPEYVEDNLATDIKISEITGKANNYTDGKVSEINSQLTASINEVDTTAKDAQTKANANATAIDELDNKIDERINDTATTTLTVTNGNTGSAKLYREGKTVSIYFVALNGKRSGGNDSTILTIPEGYRPPISFEQLVGSIDRSTLNSAQLSIGADGAIKWRRNSSYGSDYTFAITYTI